MAKQDQTPNPDDTQIVDLPLDVVGAAQTMAEQVAGHGFDTYPNQFAEEHARARELADAKAAGARAGADAAAVAVSRQPGGVSHLRELARAEAAKAYQEEYDKARQGESAAAPALAPEEQQEIVKQAVENPNDRPA